MHCRSWSVNSSAGHRREVDPIGPGMDVPSGRQVATLPALVILLPGRHQAAHGRCREPRCVGAQERRQRLLELAGRDALQVEPGQQLLDVPRPPQERRQHLRGEADARAGRPRRRRGRATSAGAPRSGRGRSGFRARARDRCAPRAGGPERPRARRAPRGTPRPRPRSPAAASVALPTATPPAADRPPSSPLGAVAGRRYPPPWRILSGDVEHHRGYAAPALIHQVRL